MTAWRAIRWSSAWLFIPLLLVCAYVGATSEQEFFGDYRLVGVTQAWVCLVVVAPGFAGWAAWDASRIRPWLDGPVGGARRPKATAGLIAPAVLIASALVLATVMLVTGLPQDLVGWAVTGCGWLTIELVKMSV